MPQINTPPIDFNMLEDLTPGFIAEHPILQGHVFNTDPQTQAMFLLTHLRPRNGAHIVDMGCGTGELARQWGELYPTLTFSLINRVQAQLDACPVGAQFFTVNADAHSVPLPDGCADVVMFTYSLCHMNTAAALAEARRLLIPGGTVFLYEMAFDSQPHPTVSAMLEQKLWARLHDLPTLLEYAMRDGLRVESVCAADAQLDPTFRELLQGQNLLPLLNNVRPYIIKLTTI